MTAEPRLELVDGDGAQEPGEEPAAGADGFRLSDVGNARRLIARHGDKLRYAHAWHRWLVWDGRRWTLDDRGAVVLLMIDTVRHLTEQAAKIDDAKARQALMRHALGSEREPRVRAALSLAGALEGVPVLHEELDADPMLLNVANGTLNLANGSLRRHDRGDLITKLAPVNYSRRARAPRFEVFFEQVVPDPEVRRFVCALLGYSLTGRTDEQLLAILYGSGSNGKTTLLETIRAMLGDYAQQAPAETFLERRDTIPNDVARLRGARFVAATETGEGRRLNEVLVKRLTGGDTIAARFMRSEWFEFRPQFKAWLATNHRPEVRGTDEAIWRRLRLVPFTVRIPDDQRDSQLAAKLAVELPGILKLAVDACLAWQSDGLPAAAAVSDATAEYRNDSDQVGRFLEECCVDGAGVKAKAGDLYARYGYWCASNGEEPLTQTAFGRRLTDRGLTSTRATKGVRWWQGVGIRHNEEG